MSQPVPQFDASKPSVTEIVISECSEELTSDFLARLEKGLQTYGTPLQPFNGRNALLDLYEEVLDACQYSKQLCLENPDCIKFRYLYDSFIRQAQYIKGLLKQTESIENA
jgi:hypothetical protein